MNSKESLSLIREIAKDLKLETKVVEAVVKSQFEAVKRKIVTTEDKKDLINFRFPYLGMMVAKDRIKEKYKKVKN